MRTLRVVAAEIASDRYVAPKMSKNGATNRTDVSAVVISAVNVSPVVRRTPAGSGPPRRMVRTGSHEFSDLPALLPLAHAAPRAHATASSTGSVPSAARR